MKTITIGLALGLLAVATSGCGVYTNGIDVLAWLVSLN